MPDSASPESPSPPARLLSLDAYRGLVMLMLAANGFGLARLAKETDCAFLDWLGFQASHPDWICHFQIAGFALWDMIQPAFMFIVGVAVPYSYAKRAALGQGRPQMLRHAAVRALLLLWLGVFLASARATQTAWLFTNVLAQIGLGYFFLVLMAGRPYRAQAITGAAVLFATWLLFVLYPIPGHVVAAAAAGEKGMLPGFFGHWSMNANAAWAFDRWFLNLFPRAEVWEGHSGGYHTLNFVPAFVTMLLGLMCGQILRDERFAPHEKLRRLALAGAACLAVGVLLGLTVCPIVKRLWTPSWTLFSGAYVIWLLTIFYWVIDVRGWKAWAYPCVVAGMNPLLLFLLGSLSSRWVATQLQIHLPGFLFAKPWGLVVEPVLVAAVFWLLIWWMHRRKFYVRL